MRKEMTARQAAQRLGVRLDVVYALLWAGKLAGHRRDGRWLIPLAGIEARLKARKKDGR